jgi:hypothetical protein
MMGRGQALMGGGGVWWSERGGLGGGGGNKGARAEDLGRAVITWLGNQDSCIIVPNIYILNYPYHPPSQPPYPAHSFFALYSLILPTPEPQFVNV